MSEIPEDVMDRACKMSDQLVNRLLPCPFCGSSDIVIVGIGHDHFARCDECGVETPGGYGGKRGYPTRKNWLQPDPSRSAENEVKAIEAWNCRAPAAALSAQAVQPLRYCSYCMSWNSKPCGEQCVWTPDMPTDIATRPQPVASPVTEAQREAVHVILAEMQHGFLDRQIEQYAERIIHALEAALSPAPEKP